MKKSLYLTSALVAVSVLALGASDATAASKAKKMSMSVSGSYQAVVGYAKQSAGFENVGSGTTRTSYNSIDVKTDSEIHMKGKTKTDSGLNISVAVEFETDQTKNGSAHIDQSYVTVGGGFGNITLGSAAAAAAIMSVNAPSTGALGVFGDASSFWIIRPSNVAVGGAPKAPGGNIGAGDHMKLRWTSPSFSGFSVGGSYVPSMTNGNEMQANGGTAGSEKDQKDIAIKYSGKMGANAVKAGATWWTQDAGTASLDAYQIGVSTTMGAFTVGAGYKEVDPTGTSGGNSVKGTASSLEEEVVNVGIQWTQGASSLSLNYFKSEMPLGAADGEDSAEKWTIGAKHTMGPGVDFLGSIQNVKWGDESNAATSNNKGTAIVGGIKVSF
jgi:predicted porin